MNRCWRARIQMVNCVRHFNMRLFILPITSVLGIENPKKSYWCSNLTLQFETRWLDLNIIMNILYYAGVKMDSWVSPCQFLLVRWNLQYSSTFALKRTIFFCFLSVSFAVEGSGNDQSSLSSALQMSGQRWTAETSRKLNISRPLLAYY